MLTKYAQDNGFHNVIEFVDDGHSGGNFQRPGFQRMLGMVENGEIGAIIVKDAYVKQRINKSANFFRYPKAAK